MVKVTGTLGWGSGTRQWHKNAIKVQWAQSGSKPTPRRTKPGLDSGLCELKTPMQSTLFELWRQGIVEKFLKKIPESQSGSGSSLGRTEPRVHPPPPPPTMCENICQIRCIVFMLTNRQTDECDNNKIVYRLLYNTSTPSKWTP